MARNPKEQKLATRHVAKNPRATQPHTQVRHWDDQRDTLDRPREKKIDADSAPTSDITVADPMSTRYPPLPTPDWELIERETQR